MVAKEQLTCYFFPNEKRHAVFIFNIYVTKEFDRVEQVAPAAAENVEVPPPKTAEPEETTEAPVTENELL